MLGEDHFDDAERALFFRRKDERIFGDVLERHARFARERMIGLSDEHGLVRHQRVKFDVRRRVEHRADGKIDVAFAELSEAGLASDVVEANVDLRILTHVPLYEWRQQVLDRRSTGRDVHGTAINGFAQRRKAVVELIDGVEEWAGEFQQAVSVMRELDPRAAAIEKLNVELALQGFDLQRDGGLAEAHLLGRLRDALRASRVTEAAELLQAILFIASVGAGGHNFIITWINCGRTGSLGLQILVETRPAPIGQRLAFVCAIRNAWAMKITQLAIVAAGAVFSAAAHVVPVQSAETTDVVVYGGTSSGIIAAIQAQRLGKSVVLIEPSRHLGGLTTGGLGATDIGNKAAIGGLARDFYHRVWRHYRNDAAWDRESRDKFNGRNPRFDPNDETMWMFEPHVAAKIFREMLSEARIEPVMNERLDRQRGVKKNGGRIESITMESGRSFAGKMFIDATYEGDLMAAAGVAFHVGREATEKYGETLNGVQPKLNVKNHRFLKPVDPYVKPGDAKSGLLWGIQVTSLPADESGDETVQAYCYRLCTTDVAENRRAWPKPAEYDPARYELLLRNFEAGDHRAPWHPLWMPNRKTDTNNNGAFSTDYIGGNYEYPNADYAQRQRIEADHRSYQQGLLWTLTNNPRVPEKVREEFNRLGMAKDEFVDNDNWPTQLYVREARRMIGLYVMTEHNCRGKKPVDDSVGLAAYGMDSHNCQRYVTPDGHAQNEGDVQVSGFKPYSISYRSIISKSGECENMLVPVCLSSSHIAYGSIRMEPVFMILGQSAATAASMAIDEGIALEKLDYERLRRQLNKDKQVLAWPAKMVVR